MTNPPAISRVHLVYILCLPLAVVVGYFWAEPLDWAGLGILLLMLGLLTVPFLMRFHYPLMLFAWNSSMVLFFISGSLQLWMVAVACSLFFSVLGRATDSNRKFLRAPFVTLPLMALLGVIMVTALLTGGIGIRILGGGTFGGRWYLFLLAAIGGYFALTSRQIPSNKMHVYLALFFLPGILAVVSNLIFLLGPKYYFFFNLFTPDFAGDQARVAEGLDENTGRLVGLYWVSLMVGSFLLARYGMRGILDIRKPWRLVVILLVFFGCLFSGFRSNLILLVLIFSSMFFFEGLWRTRLMPVVVMLVIFVCVMTLPFVSSLPLSAQRTLSFLPVDIDVSARLSAQDSTEWRVEMWRLVLPEVPKYLIKGKGYTLNPAELAMVEDAYRRGYGTSMEMSLFAGDYHSGPLSVIIPFGVFGVITFVWFLAACVRALWLNRRYGDPSLYYINTFFLAYFVARIIFFVFIFGAINAELWIFTGIIGLSIALNGGVKRFKTLPEPETALHPALA